MTTCTCIHCAYMYMYNIKTNVHFVSMILSVLYNILAILDDIIICILNYISMYSETVSLYMHVCVQMGTETATCSCQRNFNVT